MRFGLVGLMLAGLLALSALPAAVAQPGGGPQCMQVYSEREIGPIKIVSRDSCHAEIYICGRTPAEATQAEQPLDCLT